jgi:hypothetical protein
MIRSDRHLPAPRHRPALAELTGVELASTAAL